MVQPCLPELRKLSEARVATNQDFIYIRQEIAELQKLQADNTASLNEYKELKQAEENTQRLKARDAERASRKLPNEQIYEITVENADKPGMPPMLWPTNMVSTSESTNTTATASTTSTNLPPIDVQLNETVHILENYIALLNTNRNHTVVASQANEPIHEPSYVPDVQKDR
jgi:C-terminal domain of tail specific protease (DUF3340)